MKAETLGAFIHRQIPNQRELIGNNILNPGTKLCIFAEEKRGKSLLSQYTAATLLLGLDWVGIPTSPVDKVLYLQTEITEGNFQTRCKDLTDHVMKLGPHVAPRLGYFLNGLHVISDFKFKINIDEDFMDLQRILDGLGPDYPDVIILDPWYRIMTHDSPEIYSKCQDRFDEIIKDYGSALIVVHHTAKPTTDYKGQTIHPTRPRGPLTVPGYFDSLVQIMGSDMGVSLNKTLRFVLRNAKQDQPDIDVKFSRDEFWFYTR